MQQYPVRPAVRKVLSPEAIERMLSTHFGSVSRDGALPFAAFGAIERLSARLNGKELEVDVRMNPQVPNDVARETIARYNRFLEEATGFNAKERARRLRKSAGGSSDET